MFFILDVGVSEGELTACEAVYVSCVQYVIKCVSSMTSSFMFLFMCNVILFRACNVVQFYGLSFMY